MVATEPSRSPGGGRASPPQERGVAQRSDVGRVLRQVGIAERALHNSQTKVNPLLNSSGQLVHASLQRSLRVGPRALLHLRGGVSTGVSIGRIRTMLHHAALRPADAFASPRIVRPLNEKFMRGAGLFWPPIELGSDPTTKTQWLGTSLYDVKFFALTGSRQKD